MSRVGIGVITEGSGAAADGLKGGGEGGPRAGGQGQQQDHHVAGGPRYRGHRDRSTCTPPGGCTSRRHT